jgi:drug/metabolite transporter (DMT)-like permease
MLAYWLIFDFEFTMRFLLLGPQQLGFLSLLITAVGWGLNWPIIKFILREWPPLSARGTAGVIAAAGLALLAASRSQSLVIPRSARGNLIRAAALNVLAWMGLSTLSVVWLKAGEGALLAYTMPIWAMLLAWPLRGEVPNMRSIIALVLGITGLFVLLAGDVEFTPTKIPGVVCALGAAALFALGTVLMRSPLPLPPLTSVAWQVAFGSLPMLVAGVLFEGPDPHALTLAGVMGMVYMTMFAMGLCYATWFAAIARLPPATAANAMLITPLVGVVGGALILGERLGLREICALVLTLAGVALALSRQSPIKHRPDMQNSTV